MSWRRCLLVLVFGVMLVSSAPAAVGVSRSAPGESHCVLRVLGQTADGELLLSPLECYQTLAAALEAASGRTVTLDPEFSGAQLLVEASLGQFELASTLGVHFDGLNGTGSSISISGAGCTGGYWNTGPSWANRISSSWNGCYRLRHHNLPSGSGSYGDTVGVGSTQNVPSSINNKAESVSYWGS